MFVLGQMLRTRKNMCESCKNPLSRVIAEMEFFVQRPQRPGKLATGEAWKEYNEDMARWQRQRGGSSTAFRTRTRQDGSGKTDVFFNRPGDGSDHGHVVQREDGGNTVYDYVRDEDGNVYTDNG